MKKLISLYTMLFVVILSGIASAVSGSYINTTTNESTYMIMIGIGLFLLAGISRNYKDTKNRMIW